VAIRKYESEKNLASFYISGYLPQLRTESGDFFFCIEIWREKTPETEIFRQFEKQFAKKNPLFPRVQMWESFRVWRSWQTQCPSWRSDSFSRFGDRKKENRGEDDDKQLSALVVLYDFLRLRCQWVGPLEDCQKKTFFYRQLHFQGLRALQRGRDWEGLMWKGLRGLRKFFFPYFGCG